MRDAGRIDLIVDALRDAWKTCPDERLGQFLDNVAYLDGIDFENDCSYRSNFRLLEDDRWLKSLEARLAAESSVV